MRFFALLRAMGLFAQAWYKLPITGFQQCKIHKSIREEMRQTMLRLRLAKDTVEALAEELEEEELEEQIEAQQKIPKCNFCLISYLKKMKKQFLSLLLLIIKQLHQ